MRTYKKKPEGHNDGTWTLLETALHLISCEKYRELRANNFWSSLAVVWKELVHSPAEHFQTPVKKLNNVNVNFSEIPDKRIGPRAWEPCLTYTQTTTNDAIFV